MRMTLAAVQQAVGARTCPPDLGPLTQIEITGVATDNRAVQPGDLFVCIAGENFDGHNFARAALDAGAVAVLSHKDLSLCEGGAGVFNPVLLVEDTVAALGRLAHYWRMQSKAKVVGVTGSAGKTTVKEVLAQLLAVRGKTARNALNMNNQIGLPLSILRTDGDEDFWVMEVGISKAHDMEELGSILCPDMALIINVSTAHMEGLGEKGVAWHKAGLLRHLTEHGQGLVSADYADLVREVRAVCPSVQFFSATGKPVRYRAAYNGPLSTDTGQERGIYRLWLDGDALDVATPFRGTYGTENAIAIAAVAHSLGCSSAEISKGFAEAALPQQRFQTATVGQWHCINDTYNANPLSMKRMLEAAAEKAGNNPLVCVLGAMGELGQVAPAEHHALGKFLAVLRPKAVFWHGKYFEEFSTGLAVQGYAGPCCHVHSVEDFMQHWGECPVESGVILFKGSRSNCLEEYCQAFEAQQEKQSVL